jgi:hypothetical protein
LVESRWIREVHSRRRAFWVNLWDITEGEQEKQIAWYLPEVNSGKEKEVKDQEGKEIPNKKEGGHHQSLHSSDSYHQGMLPETETQHQKKEQLYQHHKNSQPAQQEMPTRRIKIHK